jgi:predicted dehydrogenase
MLPRFSRRRFLGSTASAAAGAFVLPRFAIGQPGPSALSKINVAVIGTTNQGGSNLVDIAGKPLARIAAVCDVDRRHLADAGRLYKKEKSEFTLPPEVKQFTDYREMLETMGDKLDAVLVCTPDHSHHHQAVAAMRRGLHVFCEKPLSNSIWGVRQMHAAAKKYKVITQMGIHNHVSDGLRLFKEWYDAGLMGAVREVHLWTDRPWTPTGMTEYPAPLPVPEGLDWEGWIGASTFRPYGATYHPFDWRSWWDYGSGTIGDLACHLMDVPYFMFHPGIPERVEVVETIGGTDIAIPSGAHIILHFPAAPGRGPLPVHWYEGKRLVNGQPVPFKPAIPAPMPADFQLPANGRLIVCEKGVMYSDNVPIGAPRIFPETLFEEWKSGGKLPPKTLPRSRGGIRGEWLDAIASGDPTLATTGFDYSAPLSEAALTGNLALRTRHSLQWDAPSMRAAGNDAANAYVKLPQRDGWVAETFDT